MQGAVLGGGLAAEAAGREGKDLCRWLYRSG